MRYESEFGIRPTQKRRMRKKYFLIFEGSKTEKAYFEGIIKCRNKIPMNDDIEIYPISREKKDTTVSNPKKIVFDLCQNLEKDLEGAGFFYQEEDRVCFIFDRDLKSFTSTQFDEVLEECEKHGHSVYITNPCFELWLLLHCDLTDVNTEEIILEKDDKAQKKLIDNALSAKISHFNSSKLKIEQFIDGIPVAVKNSKQFTQNISELKHSAGTNLASLFEDWGF